LTCNYIGRIYKKIDNFKKYSKDDLLEHIQQHSTCLKAEIYKNITWLQVLDVSKFSHNIYTCTLL